ncbi:hypothetical protein M0802_002039 [Mischocyttarus mexicanus]|nr:hypothetical protein M0802_002039 [Mischocyttarus mexicanus]
MGGVNPEKQEMASSAVNITRNTVIADNILRKRDQITSILFHVKVYQSVCLLHQNVTIKVFVDDIKYPGRYY